MRVPLNKTESLTAWRKLFATLDPPNPRALAGVQQGEIVGPRWQTALSRPALWVCRLSGWWGKQFDAHGRGVNVVQRGGDLRSALPIHLELRPSKLDGRPSLAVVYGPDSPWPWPWVVDELRRLDDRTCLGLAVFTPLRLATFAFLLTPVTARVQP